jgi:hypothetical protein
MEEPYLGFCSFDAVGEASILHRFGSITGWCHFNFVARAVREFDFFCDII